MKQEHTPGPWTLGDGHDVGDGYAICAGPQIVARVVGCGYPIGLGHAPESDANAALITRAPAMLELLERVSEFLDGQCDIIDGGWPDPPRPNEAMSLKHEVDVLLGTAVDGY